MLNLTQWAWSALKSMTTSGLTGPNAEAKGSYPAQIQDLSRIVFVCRVSMRLLRFYILELYPVKSIVYWKRFNEHLNPLIPFALGKHSKKLTEENVAVVRAIVNVRITLRSILSDSVLDLLKKGSVDGSLSSKIIFFF